MAKAAKKEEVTEIVKPAVVTPSTLAAVSGDWGSEGIDSRDIIIPKILVMQGLSRLVADDKAQMGEFRDSLNGTLLGSATKPVRFVAFNSFKTWTIYEKHDKDYEYVRVEPYTMENKDWRFEDTVNGVEVRRDLSLNFYALLEEDIKNGTAFPYVLAFRRTSRQAGKKIANTAARLKMFKRPLASKVFELSASKQKNDKGTFYVLDVNEARDSTDAEIGVARQWYDTLRIAQVRVDDSDEHQHVQAEAAGGAPFDNQF